MPQARQALVISLFLTIPLVSGCRVCQEHDWLHCKCEDGKKGVQACSPSGLWFAACECDPAKMSKISGGHHIPESVVREAFLKRAKRHEERKKVEEAIEALTADGRELTEAEQEQLDNLIKKRHLLSPKKSGKKHKPIKDPLSTP